VVQIISQVLHVMGRGVTYVSSLDGGEDMVKISKVFRIRQSFDRFVHAARFPELAVLRAPE